MKKPERIWWAAVVFWGLALAFWQPKQPPLYTQVPSVAPYPQGYRIFYDLVERHTKSIKRTLQSSKHLKEVDVLVVLNPSEGFDKRDREEVMDWVKDRGGTLLVGYPIVDEHGQWLPSIVDDSETWSLSTWNRSDSKLKEVSYVPVLVEKWRKVEPFSAKFEGEMVLGEGSAKPLAVGDDGSYMATYDSYGTGQIIQLADARMLNNESMGFKKSHLFAAALIDEIGQDKRWVFDESHEGVSIQPSFTALLGSGPFRAIFLHLLLFFLFWYWYKSRRHVRVRMAPDLRKVREVTTMAADVGNFYFRAKKSHWALSRYLAYFKRKLQDANVSHKEREAAMQLEQQAMSLNNASAKADAQLQMIRQLAQQGRKLDENTRTRNET